MVMVVEDVFDWVVGLEIGVDDYVIKLFDFEELCMWIEFVVCCVKGLIFELV